MRIDVMYWGLKLGREWATHPEFKAYMLQQREKLIKALEVGGILEDTQFIDEIELPKVVLKK